MKSIKNYFTGSVLARIITSILLFIGLTRQQIGYYKFLRLIVFITAIYTAYISFKHKKQFNFGVWLFIIIAILFNPIIPFYLGKTNWQIADGIIGVILILSIFFIREK